MKGICLGIPVRQASQGGNSGEQLSPEDTWTPAAIGPHIGAALEQTHAATMRILQLALAGLVSLATADSNLTHESRNILPSTFKPPQHFRNVNLVRNINLEKSYPRETVNVVIENVDVKPQTEYYLPFEQGLISRIGGLEVRDKKDAEKAPFAVEVAATDANR